MATSSATTAGQTATATQYNDLRTDAITRERVYIFEVKGSIVTGDEQGPKYIVPANATVNAIKHKIASGTSATFRVQKDTTDIDASIAATSTVAEETTISSASLTENQVLSLDVTAISGSPVDLLVQVITTETI